MIILVTCTADWARDTFSAWPNTGSSL